MTTTTTPSNLDRFSKADYIGPGTWFLLHTKAKEAVTLEQKKEFKMYFIWLRTIFVCLICREHMKNYEEKFPIDAVYGKIMPYKGFEDTSMFIWSVLFHNAVNERLHKPRMEVSKAFDLYYGEDSVCMKDCAADEAVTPVETSNATPSLSFGQRSLRGKNNLKAADAVATPRVKPLELVPSSAGRLGTVTYLQN